MLVFIQQVYHGARYRECERKFEPYRGVGKTQNTNIIIDDKYVTFEVHA